jgi:RNA polymerase sigma-70 factor (ECF subfamily)
MADLGIKTLEDLERILERVRAGDSQAMNVLVERMYARLRFMAEAMLRRFPKVARWRDAEDVLHGSALRLMRSLQGCVPNGPREFLGLASLAMNRELLSLKSKLYGKYGDAAHHASPSPDVPLEAHGESDSVELAAEIHDLLESLPGETREVVYLLHYQALGVEESARLLQVSDRTVRRRWRDARIQLHRLLKGERNWNGGGDSPGKE